MPTKDLTFRLFGQDAGATMALQRLSKVGDETGDRLKKSFGGVAKVAAGIGLGAAAGVALLVKTGIGEVLDASAGMAQLQSGIKSTGGVAGVTANHMEDLASSIQDYSGQTDDSIVKTESLLLTFTNIRNKGPNKIFDLATKAAADMAAKMGGDASSKAIMLGKALNDPEKGISKLTKVGVTFTEAQKKQVAAMEKAGDTAGAQKIILGELNREFGGAAKAAGGSLPGQLARVQRAFEDVSQTVMTAILPVIVPAIGKITKAIKDSSPKLQEMAKIVAKNLAQAFKDLAPVLATFGNFLVTKVVPGVAAFAKWMGQNKSLVLTLAGVIVGLVAAYKAYTAITAVVKVATAAWAAGQAILNIVLSANPIGIVVLAVGALIAVVILLVTHWKEVCAFLQTVWAGVCKWLADSLNTLGKVWAAAWSALTGAVHAAWSAVSGAVSNGINAVLGFFAGAGGWLVDTGKNLIQGLLDGASSLLSNIGNFFLNLLPGWIVGPFKAALGIHSPSKVFHGFGQNIVQGLHNGMLGSKEQIGAASKKLADTVIGMFESKKISKSAENAALDVIDSGTKRLEKIAAKRAVVAAKLKTAQTALHDALANRKDYAANVKSSVLQSGDVSQMGSAGDMVQRLSDLVAHTKQFRTILKKLVGKGIDQNTYGELVQAGVEGGGLTAAQSLLANPIDLRQVVSLQKQLSTAAGGLGTDSSRHVYSSKVARDSGRVDDLKDLDRAYARQQRSTAASTVRRVERDVHVHINLSGHLYGSKTDLAKAVTDAIRAATRSGAISKDALKV